MSLSYAARLSPLGPETVWTLSGATLTRQRGGSQRTFALTALRRMTIHPAGPGRLHPMIELRLGAVRMTIPGAGFGPRGVRAAGNDYARFVRILAAASAEAAPKAVFALNDGPDRNAPVIWAIGLLAAGAAGLLLTAFSSVTRGLGLSLASWLAFGALVLAAVLPWLQTAPAQFDPLALPERLFSPGG